MDTPQSSRRVTAIVPCYNEAQRVGAVLDTLVTCPFIDEIIVIDDGSSDGTATIVSRYPVKFLRNQVNRGKGYSLDRAIGEASGDILFFCDADIRGLSHAVVKNILSPVMAGEVDLSIGMRNRKIYFIQHILKFIPLLGGERALTRTLWHRLPEFYKHKFRIEIALNFYAKYYGKGFTFQVYRGITQTIKERKYGWWKGLRLRFAMFADVILANLRLEILDIPRTERNKRLTYFNVLWSSVALLLSLGVAIGSAIAPHEFTALAIHRLAIDSAFADLLFRRTFFIGFSVITVISGIVAMGNFIFFMLQIHKVITEQFHRFSFFAREKLPQTKVTPSAEELY